MLLSSFTCCCCALFNDAVHYHWALRGCNKPLAQQSCLELLWSSFKCVVNRTRNLLCSSATSQHRALALLQGRGDGADERAARIELARVRKNLQSLTKHLFNTSGYSGYPPGTVPGMLRCRITRHCGCSCQTPWLWHIRYANTRKTMQDSERKITNLRFYSTFARFTPIDDQSSALIVFSTSFATYKTHDARHVAKPLLISAQW